jgi:hypothetical protein
MNAPQALGESQHDIDNRVELYRHGQEALALTYTTQPKNTQKSYSAIQKEWEVSEALRNPYYLRRTDEG